MANNHIHKDYFIVCYLLDGTYVAKYENATICAKKIGSFYRSVLKCANGESSTLHNYQIRWVKKSEFSEHNIEPINVTSDINNKKISVVMKNDKGKIIKKFSSINEAAKYVNTTSKSIRLVLQGKQKHAGGYIWEKLE